MSFDGNFEVRKKMKKKLSEEEKEHYLNVIKQANKDWEKHMKEAEERGEKVETYLKEHLTLELNEENKTNIRYNIKRACQSIIWKEHYKLVMQLKNAEAISYLDDLDNWKKAEKEVREKLHVPDTIPIIYK